MKWSPAVGAAGRAFLLCVHRLVAVFIPELFGDIRGQRHLPYSVEHREDIVALVFEFQKAVSALDALQNLCTKKPVPEYNFSTRLTAPSRSGERFPYVKTSGAQKHHLDGNTAVLLDAVKTWRV